MGASSRNERLPDAAPAAVGVNVTATVQFFVGSRVFAVEQVVPDVAMANGPEIPISLNVRLLLPALVNVTLCEPLVVPTNWPEKINAEVRLTRGSVPVPLNVTICGVPPALSASARLPERAPLATGVKVILIAQLPPAATGVLVLQVVPLAATAKSPVAAMPVMVSGAVPLLVTVRALAVLVVPTG